MPSPNPLHDTNLSIAWQRLESVLDKGLVDILRNFEGVLNIPANTKLQARLQFAQSLVSAGNIVIRELDRVIAEQNQENA